LKVQDVTLCYATAISSQGSLVIVSQLVVWRKASRQTTGVVIVSFGCIAIFVLFHVENSIQ